VNALSGDAAGWRYVEFFTANIRNPHTRRAYARACSRFFAWCDDRGLTLTTIGPHDVATYIEALQQTHGAPAVKQQLAAVRMLFDWLITGQVAPSNPASAVRGPKRVVKTGKTPVLEGEEWRRLIDAIPAHTVRDLRDRALIATLTYGFARIGAALKMRVEDLQSKGSGWLIRLHEKGGKQHMMPCHHALAEALHALYRRRRHRPPGGQEGVPVPHVARPRRHGTLGSTDDPGRRLAHGAQARARRRHHGADRQPLVPGDRHHGVSRQWRHAGTRTVHGGARKPAYHQALRSHQGAAHPGRDRAHCDVRT
jgi:integrase